MQSPLLVELSRSLHVNIVILITSHKLNVQKLKLSFQVLDIFLNAKPILSKASLTKAIVLEWEYKHAA